MHRAAWEALRQHAGIPASRGTPGLPSGADDKPHEATEEAGRRQPQPGKADQQMVLIRSTGLACVREASRLTRLLDIKGCDLASPWG
jgi:hypothetical protein